MLAERVARPSTERVACSGVERVARSGLERVARRVDMRVVLRDMRNDLPKGPRTILPCDGP